MQRKFLICKNCGNLIEMINDSGVTPICCNKEMGELIANTTEAATEKHIPVIEINDNIVTITVGEIPHPMTEEHYISWIYLETNKGIKKADLKPNEEPKAKFSLLEDEKVINAYAYCNLHSLWKKEM